MRVHFNNSVSGACGGRLLTQGDEMAKAKKKVSEVIKVPISFEVEIDIEELKAYAEERALEELLEDMEYRNGVQVLSDEKKEELFSKAMADISEAKLLKAVKESIMARL